jgi:uncharacterized OsmC-like protein
MAVIIKYNKTNYKVKWSLTSRNNHEDVTKYGDGSTESCSASNNLKTGVQTPKKKLETKKNSKVERRK